MKKTWCQTKGGEGGEGLTPSCWGNEGNTGKPTHGEVGEAKTRAGLGKEEFPQAARSGERKGKKEGSGRGEGWGCSLVPATLIPKPEARVGLHGCMCLHTRAHTRACLRSPLCRGLDWG